MSEEMIQKCFETRKLTAPEINPETSALLIIDMQEYQVKKEWAPYKLSNAAFHGMLDYFMEQTATVAEPNIRKLIDFFRKHNLRIIYTMYASFDKDGNDLPKREQERNRISRAQIGETFILHKDHPGAQIIDSVKPEERDLIVIKNTSNVFTTTKLEFILNNMGIEQLFVTGVVTNVCVEGAARTADELGFGVFLIDDACAALSPEMHAHTLRSFGLSYGFVMTTDEALASLQKGISAAGSERTAEELLSAGN